MKLIIQIPCYNEAENLIVALDAVPKAIEGIDSIEYLISNDGSKDKPVDVARVWGVNYVVSLMQDKGFARGFAAGIDACLRNGEDIIVNTDADNQYCADDIEKLVRPILDGQYDILIGERPIELLSPDEVKCVRNIESATHQIELIFAQMLMHDDLMRNRVVEYIAELHESFVKYERIDCKDKDEEGNDNYPYSEKVYAEEFDKLNSRLFKSSAVKNYKKMCLIEKITVDKNQFEAHEYFLDFLRLPTLFDEAEIAFFGMHLVEIHRTMLELEKLVEKEPFYGVMIVDRKEFDQRTCFGDIFKAEEEDAKEVDPDE